MYADEASQSVVPYLSYTYAPKGQTPTITINTEISARLYMASAIGQQGEMHYVIRNKPFDSAAIVEFLQDLRAIFKRKLLLIWDGASIHTSKEVKSFLDTIPEQELFLVKQPTYAPELNADEQVWAYLKNVLLKNFCFHNINELFLKLKSSLDFVKENTSLVVSFFSHPKLGFL